MVTLTPLGAARTVTGSMHLLKVDSASLSSRVLLDCGLFQGHRREAWERNRRPRVDVAALDAVVLSHAHLDHSGALPMLVKAGWRGPIYATAATRDLCAVMLRDAATVQEADARYLRNRGEPAIEPLYDVDDVVATLALFVGVPYHRRQDVAPGVAVTFLDAGHVLGSAITVVEAEGRRIVFTGDLGRRAMPILRDPELPSPGADLLVMESTYGDRRHPPVAAMDDALADVLARTHARGGKVVVPTFALERAQELILAFKRLRAQGRMPAMPVYLDSPLAVRVTDVFRLHPECYDRETRALLDEDPDLFGFPGFAQVSTVEESMAIDRADGPLVVLAGSGMCEGGRVLHHLRATVEDSRHAVVIVGFQAQHTLGRRLVERRPRVRLLGLERDRRCEVVALDGFSAHADQRDLVEFAVAMRARATRLVHGEPPAQAALTEKLVEQGVADVAAPDENEPVSVGSD